MRIRDWTMVSGLALMLSACSGADDAGAPAGDAGAGATEPAAAAGTDPVTRVAEKAAEVTSCLDMVKQQQWVSAVTACTKAASVEPENQEVEAALESAQKGAAEAQMADAQKAADDAAKVAQGAADSAMKDATQGLMGGTH